MNSLDPLDPVFRALSDPTRRAILDRLREGEKTTGELAAAFPTSRFAVMKHLEVLVDCGLVAVRRRGRERWNHLNAVPLARLYERWVRPYESHWARGLLALADHVETSKPSQSTGDNPMSDPAAPDPSTPPAPAPAESSNLGRFALDLAIAAPPERVWRALVDETASWWPQEMRCLSESSGIAIEARAGGRFYEWSANGGELLWGTVIALAPGKSIDFVSHSTAAFGGPTVNLIQYALVESEGGGTRVELTQDMIGRASTEACGQLEEGWRLLLTALRDHVERG